MKNTRYAYFDNGGKLVRVVAERKDKISAEDEVYDPKIHRLPLVNEDRTLRAQFIKALAATHGDEASSRRAHFRFMPLEKKQNARGDESKKPARYDVTRGERLHVNTGSYSESFNERAAPSPYMRDANGRLTLRNPDLKSMRPRSVKSARDFVDIMLEGNPERWQNSKVLHHEHAIDTNRFFVRYGRGNEGSPRFVDLVNRLEKSGAPIPCLMEIKPKSGVMAPLWKNLYVKSQEIEFGETASGKTLKIAPGIKVPFYHTDSNRAVDNNARMAFMHDGTYFVMGYAELKKKEYKDQVIYFLNMTVEYGDQVVRADLESIHAGMRAKRGASGQVPGLK